MTEPAKSELRSLLSVPFLFCSAILLVAALGLRPGIASLTRGMSKESISLRKPFEDFDVSRLPSFRHMADGGFFPKPISSYVGTEEAISLTFELQEPETLGRPSLQVNLFATYYSNPRDTVPHTPEVCYRQGGAVVNSVETIQADLPGLDPEHQSIEVRLLNITPLMLAKRGEEAGGQWRQALIYTFVCNGEFYPGRERLRLAIGLPGDRYTYFSKVEFSTPVPPGEDFEEAVDRCKRLLREAMPVLVSQHYPTKEDVRGQPEGIPAGSGATEQGRAPRPG